MKKGIVVTLSLLMAAAPVFEAHARGFGIGRVLRAPFRAVRVLPVIGLRRALGVVVVASVGVVILSGLTRSQRAEVGRRTTKVVESDPNSEASDTYETKKGGKTIKITASPSLPPDKWRDDPALKMADNEGQGQKESEPAKKADSGKGATGGPELAQGDGEMTETQKAIVANEKKAKKEAKAEEKEPEHVKLAALPADTSCRKVVTEAKTPGNEKKNEAEKVETNAALLCKMGDGKWEPVTL